MSWTDLLHVEDEISPYPWTGERVLRFQDGRAWKLEGVFPREHGWYAFTFGRRNAKALTDFHGVVRIGALAKSRRGFLVGNRFVEDTAFVDPDPSNIFNSSEEVFLIEEGLDRFQRITAGRFYENGPLIFDHIEMPLGPEADVLDAFLNRQASLLNVKGVPPALEAAFRMECFQRDAREQRRIELARLREREEQRLQQEEQRRVLFEKIGTGVGRRKLAAVDFVAAATAALAVGNAEYLDSRKTRGEYVVKFRLENRRFECTCDEQLRIIDSGICLQQGGERGDDRFTLESISSVIREAIRKRVLHVYRHVDGEYDETNEDFDD